MVHRIIKNNSRSLAHKGFHACPQYRQVDKPHPAEAGFKPFCIRIERFYSASQRTIRVIHKKEDHRTLNSGRTARI